MSCFLLVPFFRDIYMRDWTLILYDAQHTAGGNRRTKESETTICDRKMH
jgi:hypothetical protein